jgi:acyl carrier protein
MALAIRHARSAQLAIAPVDWSRLVPTFGRNVASIWHDFVKVYQAQADQPRADRPRADRGLSKTSRRLVDVIAGASPAVMRTAVVAQLQAMAAAALGVEEPGWIDPDQPLQDMGLDSIMAVDLRNTLAHALGGSPPATVIFDHPTVNSLADYSMDLILGKRSNAISKPVQEDSDDLLALIEGLSDDEVDARLLSRSAEIVA